MPRCTDSTDINWASDVCWPCAKAAGTFWQKPAPQQLVVYSGAWDSWADTRQCSGTKRGRGLDSSDKASCTAPKSTGKAWMSREKVPSSQHDCGIAVGAAIVFKYADGSESTLMKLVQKEGPQSARGWSSRRNPGRRITKSLGEWRAQDRWQDAVERKHPLVGDEGDEVGIYEALGWHSNDWGNGQLTTHGKWGWEGLWGKNVDSETMANTQVCYQIDQRFKKYNGWYQRCLLSDMKNILKNFNSFVFIFTHIERNDNQHIRLFVISCRLLHAQDKAKYILNELV